MPIFDSSPTGCTPSHPRSTRNAVNFSPSTFANPAVQLGPAAPSGNRPKSSALRIKRVTFAFKSPRLRRPERPSRLSSSGKTTVLISAEASFGIWKLLQHRVAGGDRIRLLAGSCRCPGGKRAGPPGKPRGPYREDFPKRDDVHWLKHTLAFQSPKGIEIKFKPVVITKFQPMERKY